MEMLQRFKRMLPRKRFITGVLEFMLANGYKQQDNISRQVKKARSNFLRDERKTTDLVRTLGRDYIYGTWQVLLACTRWRQHEPALAAKGPRLAGKRQAKTAAGVKRLPIPMTIQSSKARVRQHGVPKRLGRIMGLCTFGSLSARASCAESNI